MNNSLKLSKIIGMNKSSIEILDILDIDFGKSMDVPYFIDIEKINDATKINIIEELLLNISKILENKHLNRDQKIKEIQSEGRHGKLFGLGFSKGGNFSRPKGANKENVELFIKFIQEVINEDDRYKNIGLFKFKLEGLGEDGLSDIYINCLTDILLRENNRLIDKLISTYNGVNGKVNILDKGIKVVEYDGNKILEYKGVKRYLTNINWTRSKYSIFHSKYDNYQKIIDDEYLSNAELRNNLQQLIKFNIKGDFNIKLWKNFIDKGNEVESKILDEKKLIKMMKNPYSDNNNSLHYMIGDILINSSSYCPAEKEVNEKIHILLNTKGINFISEHYITNSQTSGRVDFKIKDCLVELKSTDNIKKIKDGLTQLRLYKFSPEKDNKCTIFIVVTTRKNLPELNNYFKNMANLEKGEKVIILSYDYLTASRLSAISEKKWELPENKKINIYTSYDI